MICTNGSCMRPVEPNQGFCGACGTKVIAPISRSGFVPAGPAAPVPTTSYQSSSYVAPVAATPPIPGPPDAVNDLTLAHGEVVKRVYPIANFQKQMGGLRGRLIVTDARIVYRAEASNVLNNSSISQEIQINDVNGLTMVTSKGITATGASWLFLLTVFVAFPAFYGLVVGAGVLALILLAFCGVLAVVIYASSRHTQLVFAINSRDSGSTPIAISTRLKGSIGPLLGIIVLPMVKLLEVFGVTDAGATGSRADYEGARQMYAEIGALIIDLQNRGVLGSAD